MLAYGISPFPRGQLRIVHPLETTALTAVLGRNLSLCHIQSLRLRLPPGLLDDRPLLLEQTARWPDLARLVPNAAKFRLAILDSTLTIA
jgi:hypothetical protein